MEALVFYTQAKEALAKAARIDEVKDIRDKAEALRLYTKQAGEGLEMQNWCAEIKIRAERRAGELLADQVSPGNPQLFHAETIGLDDLGINRAQSHRFQAIASLPAEDFEVHIAETKAEKKELTSAGLYRKVKQSHQRTASQPQAPTEAELLTAEGRWQLMLEDYLIFFEKVSLELRQPEVSVERLQDYQRFAAAMVQQWTTIAAWVDDRAGETWA